MSLRRVLAGKRLAADTADQTPFVGILSAVEHVVAEEVFGAGEGQDAEGAVAKLVVGLGGGRKRRKGGGAERGSVGGIRGVIRGRAGQVRSRSGGALPGTTSPLRRAGCTSGYVLVIVVPVVVVIVVVALRALGLPPDSARGGLACRLRARRGGRGDRSWRLGTMSRGLARGSLAGHGLARWLGNGGLGRASALRTNTPLVHVRRLGGGGLPDVALAQVA